jgi:hypothetical protein
MTHDFQRRLSSWRHVAREAEQSTQRWSEYDATDELLAAHLQRLHHQCLQTLQARDRFYFALKAYVEQGGQES